MKCELWAFELEVYDLCTRFMVSFEPSMKWGTHTWLMKVSTTVGVTAEATVMVLKTMLVGVYYRTGLRRLAGYLKST